MRNLLVRAVSPLLVLSACSDSASETGPGGVSVEDAKALDRAAERLDAEAAETQK